jgi:hypothetical protein
MPTPSPYDHVIPAAADYPPGVYRVVGTGDGTVTLLRVTDAEHRRIHTGELVSVDADAFEGFVPVDPPTADRSVAATVASALGTGYWSLRAFARELAARPVAAAVALGLVLVGGAGDAVVPLPGLASGALLLLGGLALAYLGAG